MRNEVRIEGVSAANDVCISNIPGGSLVVVTRGFRVGEVAIKRSGHDEIVYLSDGAYDMPTKRVRVRPLTDSERIVLTSESYIPF